MLAAGNCFDSVQGFTNSALLLWAECMVSERQLLEALICSGAKSKLLR